MKSQLICFSTFKMVIPKMHTEVKNFVTSEPERQRNKIDTKIYNSRKQHSVSAAHNTAASTANSIQDLQHKNSHSENCEGSMYDYDCFRHFTLRHASSNCIQFYLTADQLFKDPQHECVLLEFFSSIICYIIHHWYSWHMNLQCLSLLSRT